MTSSTDLTAISDEVVDLVIPYSPEYTPEKKFERAKKSVQKQSVDTNLIIVEDGDGPAEARNIGLERSENRFVAFLNADDYFHPQKLKRQLEELKDQDKGVCLTWNKKHGSGKIEPKHFDSTNDFVRKLFLEQIVSVIESALVDTSKVSNRFDEEIYRREDHLYLLEAVEETGITAVEEPLTFVDKHDQGMSASEDPWRKIEAQHELYEKVVDIFPELSSLEKEFFRHAYHRAGRQLYFQEDYSGSAKLLVQSLKSKPSVKTAAALGLSTVKGVIS